MLAERRKWPRDLSNGFGRRAQKPIHELRKELGSVITAKYRLFPASKVLGHANPGITAKYYADKKGRVTVGLGHLLGEPENVVEMPSTKVTANQASVTTKQAAPP
jgi:hypothetical protein